MIENSRVLPLLILNSNDGEPVEGITRMQKLVFLAQRSFSNLDVEEYEFVPDDYGPFSKTLYDDIDDLVNGDYVSMRTEPTPSGNEKQVYQLSDRGEMYLDILMHSDELDEDIASKFDELKEEYNDLPLLKLLKIVYNEYPEMAVNSKLDLL